MYRLLLSILPFFLLGCGSSKGSEQHYETYAKSAIPICKEGEYLRLKTKECLPLRHPEWGFAGFSVPVENLYEMKSCQESELEELIANLPKEGGKIVMPECTIELQDGIVLKDNTILEGAGIGKTILSNHGDSAVSLHGKNIVVRDFTLEGNSDSLNGINGYKNSGNILVERIEARNFKYNQGAGISFLTKERLENSRITVRYCITSGQLHGIVAKVHTSAKMLIYSNEAYGNYDYGIDISSSSDFEVAGNYLHDNQRAGAKSPMADNILYHHNDINFNGKYNSVDRAGIAYTGSNPKAEITLEYNDLTNNGGKAFTCWSANLAHVILRENLVRGSTDRNGYNIGVVGVKRVDIYGENGRIWSGEDSTTEVVYH